jgi:hypothetical protein
VLTVRHIVEQRLRSSQTSTTTLLSLAPEGVPNE